MLTPFKKKPSRVFKTPSGDLVYGVMAEYPTAADVYHAAEKVRDAGYTRWDVFSPFPMHGIDTAMGLKTSRLPLICGIMGLTGAGLAFFMQWGISYLLYPMVVQGKPPSAWQAYVPITFELGVLVTAFTALFGMLVFNGLPRWYHPLMAKERFLRVSDDRFVICVEATDPKFDPEGTRELLESIGGRHIDLVEE